MKKAHDVKMLILCISLLVTTSCTFTSRQETTVGDAQSVVASLPDFKRQLQYLSVEAALLSTHVLTPWPRLYQSSPKLADDKTDFVHEIIYQTKSGGLKLVLLNDARPPKIVGGGDLK